MITDTVLLGDDSCNLELCLMTPHHNTVDVHQRAYSELYKKESYQKMLWVPEEKRPYFAVCHQMSLEEVPSIIFCCFLLYNNARYLQDEDFGNEDDNLSHEKE